MQDCAPTESPGVDRDALHAKYLAERDKRLRPEGRQQYLEADNEFAEFGIQVDSDAYRYLPLLEETGYLPREESSSGDECPEHPQRIGKHFGSGELAGLVLGRPGATAAKATR